ncbi:MAG: alpha/beta fold hydrolase [Anaerolineae bacterium]|nr:alpha/beta fold hydrolase [Anaerolineae bacterium]
MKKRIGLFVVLLVGLIGVWVEGARAQEPFTFEPSDCMFSGIEAGAMSMSADSLGFECGYVTVPEEHANPDGPTIRIPVAILRATGPNPQPDPLFLAQGGPGGDAFELFSFYLPQSSLVNDRDLVVINQRGTIYAEPDLRCTEITEGMGEILGMSLEAGTARYNELLQACYQRLEADGVNLSAFDSIENANDMAAVRQALGYDEYNFYGVSYGTLLALHLMREQPEGLRSVILDGVVPTSSNFIASLPENENRVYEELFNACANDAACAADYPNLESRFQAVVDELNANPIMLELIDPDTGEKYDALVDGAAFVSVVYQLLYLPEAYAMFPNLVANAERGNFALLQQMWPLFAFDRTSSYGMYYSVICAEDADFDSTTAASQNYPPFIADKLEEELQSYLDACALWPVALLSSFVDEPVASDIPVLLMSGRFDPITPPSFAEEAAQTLPNSTHIVDPWASHSIAFNDECVNGIMDDFLANPNRPFDTSCLAAKQPADFVPPDAISVPMLAKLGQLESGVMMQIGLSALLLLAILFAIPVWFVVWLIQSGKSDRIPLRDSEKRLRLVGRLLVIAYGVFGVMYASALTAVLFIPLLEPNPMASMLSVSGSTWPIFAAGWLLVLLALGMVITAVFYWRQSWSVWRKVYYSFLALCAVGYVIILGVNGLLTVL